MVRWIAIFALIAGAAFAQAPDAPRMMPPWARYTVAICAASEEINEDCLVQGRDVAAFALSEQYVRAVRGHPWVNSIRLRFPHGWAEASQTRFMRDVEERGIRLARAALERDAQRGAAAPRLPDWEKGALAEAADGRNWAHDWPQGSHDFGSATILRQLREAGLHAAPN